MTSYTKISSYLDLWVKAIFFFIIKYIHIPHHLAAHILLLVSHFLVPASNPVLEDHTEIQQNVFNIFASLFNYGRMPQQLQYV